MPSLAIGADAVANTAVPVAGSGAISTTIAAAGAIAAGAVAAAAAVGVATTAVAVVI